MDIQLLKSKLKYHNKTYQEIADALNITRDTFARRIKSGRFSVQDVAGMIKAIPLTWEEAEEIFLERG